MQSEPNLLIPMGQREKIEDLVPNCLPGMQIDKSDECLSGSGSSRRMDGQKLHPSALVDWKSWTHHTFAPTTEMCRFRRHGSRLVIHDSDPLFSNLDS